MFSHINKLKFVLEAVPCGVPGGYSSATDRGGGTEV
jgi:hypothetical protein